MILYGVKRRVQIVESMQLPIGMPLLGRGVIHETEVIRGTGTTHSADGACNKTILELNS